MNRRSRSALALALLFTIVGGLPALARADAVVLLPMGGSANADRLEHVEGLFSEILREQGHRLVAPSDSTLDRPPTSARMSAIATASNGAYVVAAEVDPLPGQYRLTVHVYYQAAGRMEELVASVLAAEERERISDILSAMVRQMGLGEDALRLTGEPEDASVAAEAERRRREAEAAAAREADEAAAREAAEAERLEAEERARREAEAQAERDAEQAERDRDAWEARPRYGTDGWWMAQLQIGGGYAVALGDLPGPSQGGGGMFDAGLRIGRTFEGVEGFELRGGADFHTGAFSAVGLHVGAAWLGSFFVEPVYIGLGGEVGVVFTVTGSRDPGFSGRLSALFAWRPVEHLYLELALPEIGVVTPGAGAVTIGASLHAGYRF